MTSFIEQEYQTKEEDYGPYFQKKLNCRTIFCNKLLKGVLVVVLIAFVFPFLAYYLAISRTVSYEDADHKYSCLVQQEYRIPCGVEGFTKRQCESVPCCFNQTTGQCHHYIPSKYFYKRKSDNIYSTTLQSSPVGSKMLQDIQFTTTESDTKLFLTLEPVPDAKMKHNKLRAESKKFSIKYSTNKFIFEVLDEDGDTILNTANGALIASENYWEWSFQLINKTLFGLDRNLISLEGNETLTKVIYKNNNDHNTQPVIWAYGNKKFYGFLVKHKGPLEIKLLASNLVIIKTLSGNALQIELTVGPTPFDIYKNQVESINLAPKWALGTHNCRKGKDTDLDKLISIYSSLGYTFDSECLHENLFETLQKGRHTEEDLRNLATLIDKITSSGTKFVFSLPPHIIAFNNNSLYTDAVDLNVLYKNSSGQIYQGTYLNLPVAYPDFTHQSIQDYIQILIKWINDNIGLNKISGFVLNDNWPQDDSVDQVDKSKFLYFSDELNTQMQYTLPWNLSSSNGNYHFEIHNSYGALQSSLIEEYFKNENNSDVFIASASKNFGDNEPQISANFQTSWDNFKLYLDKMLFSSISGEYMIGLPICGDTTTYDKTLHETLCLRWYIAAATMPYFRVSSGNPYRDPSSLNTLYTTNAVTKAISIRKQLQEYFYTILSKNEPLIRPIYYDYYENSYAFSSESQYTIGKDLLIAHPLTSGRAKLQVYLPPERGIWYEFWDGTLFSPTKKNKYFMDIDIIETDWIAFIAQGSIVTLTDQNNNLDFYVALDCSDTECTAKGELLKDEAQLLSITATKTSITISNLPTHCSFTLGFIKYYGYDGTKGYSGIYSNKDSLCSSTTNTVTINYITTEEEQ